MFIHYTNALVLLPSANGLNNHAVVNATICNGEFNVFSILRIYARECTRS